MTTDGSPPDGRPPRSWGQRIVIVLAASAIVGGLVIAGSIAVFLHHSSTTGNGLVRQERKAIASTRAAGTCVHTAQSPLVTSPDGQLVDAVLEIPKLGLAAPVLQGTDDAQLNIGVGHVPNSSWPGFTGTDVLSAHDVTWFSQINRLSIGDTMSMVTPCHTFRYTVTGHSVVKAGSPVFQTVHGRLVLVTCYPLNALYLTPNRYLVEATLTAVNNAGQVTDPNPTSGAAPLPSVPAPPALVAQGLDLAHNETPLGVLTFSGTPTDAWTQSPAPLQAEAVVLQLYFAALRSAEQGQAGWWTALAPQVSFAAAGALHGVSTPQTVRPLQPTLDMEGTTLTGATVSTSLRVPAGTYSVTMTATIVNGQLVMTGFSMQPS